MRRVGADVDTAQTAIAAEFVVLDWQSHLVICAVRE